MEHLNICPNCSEHIEHDFKYADEHYVKWCGRCGTIVVGNVDEPLSKDKIIVPEIKIVRTRNKCPDCLRCLDEEDVWSEEPWN